MHRHGSIGILVLVCVLGASDLQAEESSFLCVGAQDETQVSGGLAKTAQAPRSRLTALVIFAKFASEAPEDTSAPSYAQDLFDPDLPGSLSHFYDQMSFGQFQITGTCLGKQYTSLHDASYYVALGGGAERAFGFFNREIFDQVDGEVDFSQFDTDGPDGIPNSGDDDGMVDFVFVNLWSVEEEFLRGTATGIKSLGLLEYYVTDDASVGGGFIRIGTGATQRTGGFAHAVGVMAHELAHWLGLPDLYDQAPGDGRAGDSAGIGKWGLMGHGALGWHGDDGPVPLCAWSRERLGWIGVNNGNLVVVDRPMRGIEIEDVEVGGKVYKLPITELEYFLIEHRRCSGGYYDRHVPGEGLLIWHVGEGLTCDDEARKKVDLECADGRFLDGGYPQGMLPDPVLGGDNLDFWSHDAGYRDAHGGNLGDGTDVFEGVRYRTFGPDTNPSSMGRDSVYAGHRVEHIHPAGDRMVMDLIPNPLPRDMVVSEIDDRFPGDGDGLMERGETVQLYIELTNRGAMHAYGVEAILHAESFFLTVLDSTSSYGDVHAGASVAARFLVEVSPQAPAFVDEVCFTMELSDRWGNRRKAVLVQSFPCPAFGPRMIYAVGASPTCVFCADLDGDGDNDLVASKAAWSGSTPGVSVFLNHGDGTFADPVDYRIDGEPVSVFCADLDGDGDQDMATGKTGGTVSVLLNHGDGTFADKVDYEVGDGVYSISIADLDGDGDNDLAAANTGYVGGTMGVSVLMNRSILDTPLDTIPYEPPDAPVSVQEPPEVRSIYPTSGFDYGGTRVAIAGSHFQSGVTVTFGDIEATDTRRVASTVHSALTPAHPVGVVDVTVINPDGGTDTLEDGFEFVFGLFGPRTTYATGNTPSGVFIADLDGDGDKDLAVPNLVSRTVSVLMNHGDGTFADKADYATGFDPIDVFSADLDADGDQDLAVANHARNPQGTDIPSVSVLLNHGDGTFADKVDYELKTFPVSLFLADLDGDGDKDIAVAEYFRIMSVLLNHGDGTFADPVDYAAVRGAYHIFIADLDGDGDNDLATANGHSNTVSVLLNRDIPNEPPETAVGMSEERVLPSAYGFYQNVPNPFNPVTTVAYDLPQASNVTLTIYTITGQKVKVLVNTHQEAGHHSAIFDGSGLANGVYLYHLEAGSFVETKRMLFLK